MEDDYSAWWLYYCLLCEELRGEGACRCGEDGGRREERPGRLRRPGSGVWLDYW